MRLWPTVFMCKGPLWEKEKVLPVGLLYLRSFFGVESWAPSLTMAVCSPVVSPQIPSLPQRHPSSIPPQNCPRWNPRTCSSSSRMFWVLNESSTWVAGPLARTAAGHRCRGPFFKVMQMGVV